MLGFSLIVCVLVTGVFSFVQEKKDSEMRAEFDKLLPEKALVIREETTRLELGFDRIGPGQECRWVLSFQDLVVPTVGLWC